MSFASAYYQFNSIILKPKYNMNNILLNKQTNKLENNSIIKYKFNEIKNDRLKIINLLNYEKVKYYLIFLFTCRRIFKIYKVVYKHF